MNTFGFFYMNKVGVWANPPTPATKQKAFNSSHIAAPKGVASRKGRPVPDAIGERKSQKGP